MAEEVALPTYATLLTEAIRSLATDSGTVTVSPPAGVAVLQDDTKSWPTDVHKGRLVKVIRGAGAGQLRIILSNSDRLLTLNQAWTVPPGTGSVYVIMGEDWAILIGTGSGTVYVNSNTAPDDNPRRFENNPKILKWAIVIVAANPQLFGNAAAQTLPLTAAGSMGLGRIDISTLYFRNQNAGQNGTVHILGVED